MNRARQDIGAFGKEMLTKLRPLSVPTLIAGIKLDAARLFDCVPDSTLPFESFDDGSVTRYAAIRVRCRISFLVAVVSSAAHAHPVARLGLLARPWSLVKRRNHGSERWFLEKRLLDFQSLLRDCRNRRRPSEIRHYCSLRNSGDRNYHSLGPPRDLHQCACKLDDLN